MYVVIDHEGNPRIQEIRPYMSEMVTCAVSFESRESAEQAMLLYRASRPSENTEKYAALEAEIEEYKAINKRLVERIDGLLGLQAALINLNRACADLLRRIMSQLAIWTIIQKTHRERNEQSRSIIKEVWRVLDKPLSDYSSPPVQDMDGIPF